MFSFSDTLKLVMWILRNYDILLVIIGILAVVLNLDGGSKLAYIAVAIIGAAIRGLRIYLNKKNR